MPTHLVLRRMCAKSSVAREGRDAAEEPRPSTIETGRRPLALVQHTTSQTLVNMAPRKVSSKNAPASPGPKQVALAPPTIPASPVISSPPPGRKAATTWAGLFTDLWQSYLDNSKLSRKLLAQGSSRTWSPAVSALELTSPLLPTYPLHLLNLFYYSSTIFYRPPPSASPKLKLLDGFQLFLMLSGIAQFAYCVLITNYPFNAFLGGSAIHLSCLCFPALC